MREYITAHPRDEVDDMTIILNFLIKIDMHMLAVARQVVPCQINQHDVLGVFLRVVPEGFGALPVDLDIARAEGRPGYRVDGRVSVSYLAVGLGRGAEDAEASEIEIEEVGRGIDTPKRAIDFEIVSPEGLLEAAAQYDLKNISPQTMPYALAYNLAMLIVRYRRGLDPDAAEVIGGVIPVIKQRLNLLEVVALAFP